MGGLRILIAAGWLPVLLVAMAWLPAQAAQTVTLMLSEPGGIYQEAAQALQQELSGDGSRWAIRLRNVDDAPSAEAGRDGLVVTLGVRALRHALAAQGDTPLLALLVPSMTFEQMMSERARAGRRRTISVLALDQPFTRQLQLIRLALPQAERVGVLVGSASEDQAGHLRKAGREVGLDVFARTIHSQEQLFFSLNELAQEVDVLLLLPDPQVLGRESLQTLFLQTYRKRLPVVAYSSSLVQAGALLGLYASPTQLGREAGQWLREMSRQDAMKPTNTSRKPEGFLVEVNRNVARSLELRLPDSKDLAARLDVERGR